MNTQKKDTYTNSESNTKICINNSENGFNERTRIKLEQKIKRKNNEFQFFSRFVRNRRNICLTLRLN